MLARNGWVCATVADVDASVPINSHSWRFESTTEDPRYRHKNPSDEFAGAWYEVSSVGDDRDGKSQSTISSRYWLKRLRRSRRSVACHTLRSRMVEKRSVALCPDRQLHWYVDLEEPGCTDTGHSHQIFEVHVHRSQVTLPDGIHVTAASYDPFDPYSRDQAPDYGLYLDREWQPPWAHELLDWPDFGVPASPADLAARLRSLHDRAVAGERVEVGCRGGHGRTGTALACLAVLCGHPRRESVAWVRAAYCPGAVETAEQEAFVAGFHG